MLDWIGTIATGTYFGKSLIMAVLVNVILDEFETLRMMKLCDIYKEINKNTVAYNLYIIVGRFKTDRELK